MLQSVVRLPGNTRQCLASFKFRLAILQHLPAISDLAAKLRNTPLFRVLLLGVIVFLLPRGVGLALPFGLLIRCMSVQSLKLRLFVLLLLQASEFLFSLHVCLVGEFIRFDCLAGFLRFPDALLILLLLLDRQLEAVVGGLERGFRVAESSLFLLVNLPLIVGSRLFISGSFDLFPKILHLLLPELQLFLAVGPLPDTFLDRGKFLLALVLQFLEPVNNRL